MNVFSSLGNSVLSSLFPRRRLKLLAREVYNYHNLGSGVFSEEEEKTPFGSGERYNFDRMYMMVSNYDFHRKSLLDLGCNSGWFTIQAKLLGTGITVGVDDSRRGMMGKALLYAKQFERAFKLGLQFVDEDLEKLDLGALPGNFGLKKFDAVLLLSVLHHIGEQNMSVRENFFSQLCNIAGEVIFYEDHEFWNDMEDQNGNKIEVKGEGYRYGWNEDMSWQRKIGAIENYEKKVLAKFAETWRKDVLHLDSFSRVMLLGFSEKRRPLLALFK